MSVINDIIGHLLLCVPGDFTIFLSGLQEWGFHLIFSIWNLVGRSQVYMYISPYIWKFGSMITLNIFLPLSFSSFFLGLTLLKH